jgi:hypothetical protein
VQWLVYDLVRPPFDPSLDMRPVRSLPSPRQWPAFIRAYLGVTIHRQDLTDLHTRFRCWQMVCAVLIWQRQSFFGGFSTDALRFQTALQDLGVTGMPANALQQAPLVATIFDGLTMSTVRNVWDQAFRQFISPVWPIRQLMRRWLAQEDDAPDFEEVWRTTNRSAATMTNLRTLQEAASEDAWVHMPRGRPPARR